MKRATATPTTTDPLVCNKSTGSKCRVRQLIKTCKGVDEFNTTLTCIIPPQLPSFTLPSIYS